MPACRESNRLRADNSIINLHARRREPHLAFAFAETMPARSSRTYLALLVVCAKVIALFIAYICRRTQPSLAALSLVQLRSLN